MGRGPGTPWHEPPAPSRSCQQTGAAWPCVCPTCPSPECGSRLPWGCCQRHWHRERQGQAQSRLRDVCLCHQVLAPSVGTVSPPSVELTGQFVKSCDPTLKSSPLLVLLGFLGWVFPQKCSAPTQQLAVPRILLLFNCPAGTRCTESPKPKVRVSWGIQGLSHDEIPGSRFPELHQGE